MLVSIWKNWTLNTVWMECKMVQLIQKTVCNFIKS